mmetsp:Transcript_29731/g.39535  ORF Transcript_29731/g.39535 Transcript_29731/m.39535 type:complete len:315 (+) Transcript_29731:508-1452(+)
MGLQNSYRTLFDLRILHRYFLDEDNNAYEENGTSNSQERFDNNRLKYNIQNFMKILPTERTQKVLKNYNGIFKPYKDGFKVALKQVPIPNPLPNTLPDPIPWNKPFIPFDANFYLDFTIEITDQLFENYTKIEWDKNGLIYLSNLDPTAYTPGSEEEPDAVTVNFSRLSEYQTQTSGTNIDINLLNDIQPRELLNKFAVIRMYLEGEPTEMQLVDASDSTKFNDTLPELDLYLKNRRTIWRYRDLSDSSIIYDTPNKKPLTENGYIKITNDIEVPTGNGNSTTTVTVKYPNPDAKILVWDSNTSEFYSEVYIKS